MGNYVMMGDLKKKIHKIIFTCAGLNYMEEWGRFLFSYWNSYVYHGVAFFLYLKVRARYAEQYDYEAISNLLGMDKGDSIKIEETKSTGFFPSLWV